MGTSRRNRRHTSKSTSCGFAILRRCGAAQRPKSGGHSSKTVRNHLSSVCNGLSSHVNLVRGYTIMLTCSMVYLYGLASGSRRSKIPPIPPSSSPPLSHHSHHTTPHYAPHHIPLTPHPDPDRDPDPDPDPSSSCSLFPSLPPPLPPSLFPPSSSLSPMQN